MVPLLGKTSSCYSISRSIFHSNSWQIDWTFAARKCPIATLPLPLPGPEQSRRTLEPLEPTIKARFPPNRKKTKEQSRPSLGLGDWFQPADPENHVVATARSLFLNVIEERAKTREVLRALRSDVFPLYQRHWPPGEGPLDRVMSPSDFRKFPDLQAALFSWADHFCLCRGDKGLWTIQTALETLALWRPDPDDAEFLAWEYPVFRLGSLLQEKIVFVDDGWNMELWDERTYRRSSQRRYAEFLENYVNAAKRRVAARGAERALRKTEREHYEWLVRHQIEGETPKSISQYPRAVAVATVKRYAGELRALVDLPERPRGRPRKNVYIPSSPRK